MSKELEIQKFYSKIKFPGSYTIEDLDYYDIFENRFLKPYVDAINGSMNILEIGCGTGYITNLVAHRNKNCHIDAIDFSDSIDVAASFSIKHNITNVTYHKQNFLNFLPTKKYDIVISNGVLHHIPDFNKAIERINKIGARTMVLGIYNKYGKLAKNFFKVKYVNDLLYLDQEKCPFELSFADSKFRKYFPNYTVESVTPGNSFVDIRNIFNYKNGGLTIYTMSKEIG